MLVAFFICPNCGNRELSGERTAGLSNRPKGCSKCGFGFLFELLDDYYPAPGAAFFTCDSDGRLIDIGKGGYELTGSQRRAGDRTAGPRGPGPRVEGARRRGREADTDANGTTDPIETTLEWGVRSLGKRVRVTAEGDRPAEAVADLFPAYDDDGGLLLVLTPE